MARLRRSKLAAGFLLLFQCLSERCHLAGGEAATRQNHGKRSQYLPGGAQRGGTGGEGPESRARAAFLQPRRGVGSARSSAGRVPERANGLRGWGLV